VTLTQIEGAARLRRSLGSSLRGGGITEASRNQPVRPTFQARPAALILGRSTTHIPGGLRYQL